MDSLQFWIYVIVAAIYLIGRAMKKAAPQPPARQPRQARKTDADEYDDAPEAEKPMSFEELLREITEARKPQPQKTEQTRPAVPPKPRAPQPTLQRKPPAPKPAYVDYDDDLKDEEKSLEDQNYNYRGKGSVTETFENAKREAFSRPSLEEAYALGKPGEIASEVEYERFGAFSIEKKHSIVNDYINELRNPSGFKKAFVLSEILNRKY